MIDFSRRQVQETALALALCRTQKQRRSTEHGGAAFLSLPDGTMLRRQNRPVCAPKGRLFPGGIKEVLVFWRMIAVLPQYKTLVEKWGCVSSLFRFEQVNESYTHHKNYGQGMFCSLNRTRTLLYDIATALLCLVYTYVRSIQPYSMSLFYGVYTIYSNVFGVLPYKLLSTPT